MGAKLGDAVLAAGDADDLAALAAPARRAEHAPLLRPQLDRVAAVACSYPDDCEVVILVDDAGGAPNNIDPVEDPIPEGAVPSPAEITASELVSWLDTRPDASAGGVSVDASGQTVTVAWKGTVPQAFRDLAGSQPAPVWFVNAAFSAAELTAEAERIANAYPEIVAGVGPRDDYSGLNVELTPRPARTPSK